MVHSLSLSDAEANWDSVGAVSASSSMCSCYRTQVHCIHNVYVPVQCTYNIYNIHIDITAYVNLYVYLERPHDCPMTHVNVYMYMYMYICNACTCVHTGSLCLRFRIDVI